MRSMLTLAKVRWAIPVVAVVVLGVVWLLGARSAPAQSADPVTVEAIVNGDTPLGSELAADLGLTLEESWDGKCQAFSEVGGKEAGYCIAGVTDDMTTLHVLGHALRGHRVTEAELSNIKESLARAGYDVQT